MTNTKSFSSELLNGLPSAQISRAIGISRILLIIGLVFLHYGSFPNSEISPFQGLDTSSHSFATWLNSSILFFFHSAVPLLSMISGWLYFSFASDNASAALKKRIKSRFVSLYVPLIIWNTACFTAIYTLFTMAPNYAHFGRLNVDLTTAGWLDYINAIFGITHPPIAFQFWFVRDLFVTVLVSPILWLLLKHIPWIGVAILGTAWMAGSDLWIFFRTDVPFFFYVGAVVRRKQLPITIPLNTTIIFITLYITLACLRALAPYVVDTSGDTNPLWLDMATRSMRIVGVLGCWGMIYRLAETSWGSTISTYGGLAFFLHSAHWPLLALIKMIIWRFIPAETDFWMLAHLVASVALTVTIGVSAGAVLARISPRFFALMNGGRLLGELKNKPIISSTEYHRPNDIPPIYTATGEPAPNA